MSASGPSGPLVYLSHKLVWVCEIQLSHKDKNNVNTDLVCEKMTVSTYLMARSDMILKALIWENLEKICLL